MLIYKKIKSLILLFGDIALFYISLYAALSLRYRGLLPPEIWHSHQLPFLFIHVLWILIFYIAGLYDISIFASFKKTAEAVFKATTGALGLAIVVFYSVPSFAITPKTNLIIDLIILAILLIAWRRFYWATIGKTKRTRILFFGSSNETRELAENLKNKPQLGYEVRVILEKVDHNLIQLIKKHKIQLLVASKSILRDGQATKRFYEALPLGISVNSFEDFYESIKEKIPVSMINEEWFLENLDEINKKFFEAFKRIFDLVLASVLMIPFLALLPLAAFLIKTESGGPLFYKQKRVGKNEKIFELIKFRTMIKDAEKDGIRWAEKEDPRVTRIGKFLRKSRLDELPQIINVLRGEMSFIGPRPERPELVDALKKEVPHYSMRHLIKPGLSGWAQIKFPYGASVEDAMQKLQYDLFYIKNRSVVLDLAIAAKTIATILSQKGR
jgi:exopolysaccharide biosynthesis polyprenyl glycosylphosphotransferase